MVRLRLHTGTMVVFFLFFRAQILLLNPLVLWPVFRFCLAGSPLKIVSTDWGSFF